MNKRFTKFAAVALSALLLLSGCSGKEKNQESEADKAVNSDIVLTVGDVEYSQADFALVYMSVYQNMNQQYGMYLGEAWEEQEFEEGKKAIDIVEESAVNQLKQMAAIRKIAEEKEIKLSKKDMKEIDEQMKSMIENMGGEEAFKTAVAEMKTTRKAVENNNEFYEIFDRVSKKLTQSGEKAYVDKDELEKDFVKDYWTVQHILVSTQAGTDEEGNEKPAKTDEEAKAIVDEIFKKIKDGAEFSALIDEYNEDPGITGDSFYTFNTGKMVPEFEEATKKLKAGEYTTEAVKTDYGYHIIKKYETDTDSDEFKQLKDQKEQEALFEIINKKVEKLKADVKQDKIDKLVKQWADERKAAAEKAKAEAAAKEEEAKAEEAPAEGEEAPAEGEEAAPAEGEEAPAAE